MATATPSCRASRVRLRPILMTTIATLVGLAPMAIHLHPGDEMNLPLARAVIGGLAGSTVLTLFVVPVLYSLLKPQRRQGGDGRPGRPGARSAAAVGPGGHVRLLHAAFRLGRVGVRLRRTTHPAAGVPGRPPGRTARGEAMTYRILGLSRPGRLCRAGRLRGRGRPGRSAARVERLLKVEVADAGAQAHQRPAGGGGDGGGAEQGGDQRARAGRRPDAGRQDGHRPEGEGRRGACWCWTCRNCRRS